MLPNLLAFLTSASLIYLIITLDKFHHIVSDNLNLQRPQKVHKILTPRIGGAGIYFGVLLSFLICQKLGYQFPGILSKIIICSIPIFFAGLLEDISNEVSALNRLIFAAFSAFLLTKFAEIGINNTDFYPLDLLLSNAYFQSIFTIFCIVGLVNSFNIIDGFNGLSSIHGLLSLALISYVSFKYFDSNLLHVSLLLASGMVGFVIWNFPAGRIFLGDSGSYLVGFWIAALSILLISRHPTLSPWLAIVINIFPVTETLFTIYRRIFLSNCSPLRPDRLHFHTIIYRRLFKFTAPCSTKNNLTLDSKNPSTSAFILFFSSIGMIPGIIWPESTLALLICLLCFTLTYIFLYIRIIRFNTPSWLRYIVQNIQIFK